MTRTPWFSVDMPPQRIGWYECKLDGIRGIFRMHWNGLGWQYDPADPTRNTIGMNFHKLPTNRWRGLTA